MREGVANQHLEPSRKDTPTYNTSCQSARNRRSRSVPQRALCVPLHTLRAPHPH
jgi:hypothetical protein